MRISIKDIPDRNSAKFPERLNVAVTREAYLKLRHLRASGKNVPEFLRVILDQALSGVSIPESEKKTG